MGEHDKARTHRCGMASGSTKDVWLQLSLLLLAQLNLGVVPQPGLMRHALALCMGLQQPVSLVRQGKHYAGGAPQLQLQSGLLWPGILCQHFHFSSTCCWE